MIDPTPDDVGRLVIYRAGSRVPHENEEGVITSINDHVVFVRYGTRQTSQATDRSHLTWANPRTKP